ncbi:hypothetical protein PVAND_004926 [Polypedilum vanderplanki]|uniref:Inner centromere protein ARK-binding domain-containing protein n=1 Tax=Polypedilum vanderplanki TaxID=319348 RepID=A0A9J6BZ77_POLVA|nr:hypothetical protein PVAND_004926 [Polypedilum vanderplanki]
MDEFRDKIDVKSKNIELLALKIDDCTREFKENFDIFKNKARDILKKRNVINPKPQKKLMRAIAEDEGDEEDETNAESFVKLKPPPKSKPLAETGTSNSSERESLRPVRSAKINANNNLKEIPANIKMRNENNVAVVIKTERISSASNKGSRDSLKENSQPNVKRTSVDEGVHLSSESDMQPERNIERSMSVEFIPSKPIQIDITADDDKMPPPPLPIKKKTRTKQKQATKQSDLPADPEQPIPRITRSKIKTEKQSIDKSASTSNIDKSKDMVDNSSIQKSVSELTTTQINETTNKRGKHKKYPMPIIVKVERLSIENDKEDEPISVPIAEKKSSKRSSKEKPKNESLEKISAPSTSNEIPMNETVTISKNTPVNETVTIENRVMNETVTLEKNPNPHDSLMTEDNDEEELMNELSPPHAMPQINKKSSTSQQQPLPLKLKKNEVFNPYLSSPVKQKVQAFEKHSTLNTPDVTKASSSSSSSSKYNTLKAGTPSKIGVYTSKTTPLSNAKARYMSAVASSASSSSASTASSSKTSIKKYGSITHDPQEEKRKQREEKQQKAQLQREAIEKQKREQTLQQQREREEKFRKLMMEKEEQKRLEALKKKQLKENQERKYQEEKLKKEEFLVPKEPLSASKDNSLYIKMQKQIMIDKAAQQQQQQKKKLQKDSNTYSFDMLNTDDSTDDESKPSKKRPDPPQWSRKQYRAKLIQVQSFTNSDLLDALFSSQPITVNLKEIFPSIEPRKLVRNSSAVWNTPPRYSQIPKY